ncbi:hypothetical protein Tco_0599721 [Tanacetum coccineum]
MQSSSVSSDFTKKLLNFKNISPTNNEIASMMDTTIRREEPSGQTSTLYTVPVTVIPEITSTFNTTTPLPPPFFNPLPHQAIPTLTPTASEQVDQYAQAISSILAIVDRYIDNKQREAIQQAIKSHTAECREEALVDRREYIDLIDTSVRAIIKEEVSSQLPQILPQAVLEFATPMIEQNIIESIEADFLVKSSSQPKSTYEAAASLSEFELTKILMDKIEEQKSYLRANYKRELYDALVKSYNTNKDLFDSYGEVFTLKRSRDDKDKDQDPSTRSDQGTKRRKSSKDVESSRDPKSKESKSTSSSKGTFRSQHKSSGKSAHTEEPSHIVGDSRVQQNQEFDMGNNDEQPNDEAASKVDWFKKSEQPTTPDPDWNKRQHVNFRPPQTWISNIARAENPPTSFDELMDTPIDFSALIKKKVAKQVIWLNPRNLSVEHVPLSKSIVLIIAVPSDIPDQVLKSTTSPLEKGYDRFQQLLSQLEAHGAEVSTEDANHKFLRSLPPAWSNLAMTMRTKPEVDTLSIDDLYNNQHYDGHQ